MAWLWIVVVLLFVVVLAIALMGIFTKTTSVTRGGVEHPARDKRRGNPPFESIERHS
jgi:hypothetical protein